MFAQASQIVVTVVSTLLFWGVIVGGIVAVFRSIRKRRNRSGERSRELALGTAGLILVSMRTLQLAMLFATDIGTLLWFVGVVGIIASHIGLVMSIAGIFKNSGRMTGTIGVSAWGIFTIVSMAARNL